MLGPGVLSAAWFKLIKQTGTDAREMLPDACLL